MSILKLKDENGNWNSIPTLKGDTGNGIESTVLNSDYTLTINYTDGTDYTTPSIRGEKGSTGSTGAKGDKGDKGDQGVQGERGLTGATPNLTVGTVDTLTPNDDATVNITGTAENPVLNFGIPKGDIGEVTNDDLTKLAIKDTASGSVASFVSDVDNIPMNSVKVRIDPVQDLHGLDAPYPAGGEKNKFNVSAITNVSAYNGTIINNGDGTVTVNHTSGSSAINTGKNLSDLADLVVGSTYILSFTTTSSARYIYLGQPANAVWTSNTTRTITSDMLNSPVYLYANGDTNPESGVLSNIQIELGTTATAYAPYENICPISGWTEVDVYNDPLHGGNIEWNQLVLKKKNGYTHNGITYTASNGVYSVNGTSSGVSYSTITNATVPNHVYFMSIKQTGTGVYIWQLGYTNQRTATEAIVSNNSSNAFGLYVLGGTTVNDSNIIPQIFDLTQMFGAGNEPSTVEEFRALFPKDYYPYNEGEKTCVSAVNGNPYRHATIDLGQTVYGGTVDIATGELVIDKVCVDLGTLWWSSGFSGFISPSLKNVIVNASSNVYSPNIISSEYKTTPFANRPDKSISLVWNADPAYAYINYLAVKDSTYSDATTFKQAMDGVQLCYELAEPITIKIPHSELRSILGQNVVFSDSGDVEVVYCVDTKTYIDTIVEDHEEQKAPVITDAVSGAIASFSDGADNLPLKSLIVDINPVQDLHGQENPYPAGGGKNKFDPNSANHNWVGTNGVIAQRDTCKTCKIPMASGTSVTLSNANASSATNILLLAFFDSNDTLLSRHPLSTGATYITATAPENTAYVMASYFTWSEASDAQLELGTTATAYAPYENLCPISGWTQVGVEQRGVNVWDEEWEAGTINNATGVSENDARYIRSKNYCTILPSTSYCITPPSTELVRIFWYDAEKSFISNTTSASGSPTVVSSPSNANYFKFKCFITTYNHDISINYPSTDHSYHPYTGRSITIQLGQTVYGGKLDVLTGELVIDRAMVDLGTLNWAYNATYNFFWTSSLPKAYGLDNATCSVYAYGGWWTGWTDKDNVWCGNLSNNNITIKDTRYSDVTAFKAAMSGVQFCYELATPIEIQLSANQLNSLYGVNNIWADSGDTEVEYRADTELFIEKVTSEVPVDDVQINGTSIVENGVANVPIANANRLGAIKATSSNGLYIATDGFAIIQKATDTEVKAGTNTYRPIVPNNQHTSTFFGLAKAAGDTSQASSSNIIGHYTINARSKISTMLNEPVTVGGTTPTIVASAGMQYICEEVATLNFTPSATGICDVIFTSGSTPTVLTLPSTVKFPDGEFTPEANKTYEINILNGVYGAVMAWT